MDIKREELSQYLRECILYQLENVPIESVIDKESMVYILEIAKEHQIMGILGRSVLTLPNIEADLREEVVNACMRYSIKSLTQHREVENLQEIFEKAHIKNIALKGSYMQNYYPSPELREMGDIDICVRSQDLDKVKSILLNEGYHLRQCVSNHHVYFKEPFIVLEVHYSMFKKEVDQIQHDYFGDFKHTKKNKGTNYCYHQSKEDFYIYMMSHMAGHFYKRGCGIRNLIDIYVYRQRFQAVLNYEYINKELSRCGIDVFVKHMNTLVDMWLGDKEFTDFYYDMFEYMIHCGIYGKDEYGIWNEYAHNKSSVKRGKVRMTLWYLFPPYHYMKRYYSVLDKYSLLLPFMWFIRLLRGVLFNRGKHKRDYLKNASMDDIDMIQNIYKNMKLDFERGENI